MTATVPSLLATATVPPLTLTVSGRFTSPTRAVQAGRTAISATLGGNSAGLGFSAPPPMNDGSMEQPAKPAARAMAHSAAAMRNARRIMTWRPVRLRRPPGLPAVSGRRPAR